ncbi:MAG TPA: glucose 1-dehydrogenase [Capsulimonadaceae bacterium]|nr:glucose 1-dehydrogenase [Capsulimonadaceae bacterium]
MFSLAGKVAVVTGAGSGIGESIAATFAQAGAFVYVAEQNTEAGNAVVEKIRKAGGKAKFVATDVSNEVSCLLAGETVLAANAGRCDILVNNAGIGHVGTALTTSGEDMNRLMAVNVNGVLFMTQALLPAMISRKSGSIVSLASIGGIVGIRDRLAYCATKFAVVGITKCMALDHSDTGVRFNCICPGRVETPFVQARLAEYPDPVRARADMTATQLVGRMGAPDEIAAAALYLASDEASFVTGSALVIDGGWSAGK